MKITADAITKELELKHADDISIRELRLSSGFSEGAGRIDLWTIKPAPSAGCGATAYEVKISRSDFKRDNHQKQRGARLFSDWFYYVAPVGLLKHEEIPDWAGLIEVDLTAVYPWERLKTVIPAPKLDKSAPSWGLIVSILRRVPIPANSNELGDASAIT